MLKIWGRRNSINVQKVMWTLGELELTHEHIPAGGAFGGLDTPAYRAMNPNGLVPVIDDGGTIIWESHSIVRYLCARYGSGTLWAEDPAERSLADRWIDWTESTLQPPFMGGVFWAFYRTPPERHDKPAIARSIARCAEIFGRLDRHLGNRPFLAGERFTMGDVPAGAQLYRYFTLDIERPSLPHVEAWYARLQERPAYREHVMVPYDDLRGRLAF